MYSGALESGMYALIEEKNLHAFMMQSQSALQQLKKPENMLHSLVYNM